MQPSETQVPSSGANAAGRSDLGPHERRHPEWRRHNLRWRWLLDSWEGGEAYRTAYYGFDTMGFPVRNLVRHKREYPDPRELTLLRANSPGGAGLGNRLPGSDQYTAATTSDYELRLARTPVPMILAEHIQKHLSRIFAREVERETTSKAVQEWWDDVDGTGVTVDRWMEETVAPLLMVFGCLDLCFDHPKAPADSPVQSRADQIKLGLDRCVVSIILPENVTDWKLDAYGDYTEAIVCEKHTDPSFGGETFYYRLWTPSEWKLYDQTGNLVDRAAHPFGRVPIKRVFDRKRPRYKNIGLPRYEHQAELQREYYNRDSELILSDTTQAHPLLQGPEDFIQADGTVQIGPNWLLPKKKHSQGGAVSYEGFDIVEFPKEGADSIRQNLAILLDRADRASLLTKPAGAAGTDGKTVAQSGISKRLDQSGGNDLLAEVASTLQRAEMVAVEFALVVMGNGTPDGAALEGTSVNYPKAFDLMSADELAQTTAEFQLALSQAGACPVTEEQFLCRLVRLCLPGLDDDTYGAMDGEIQQYLAGKAEEAARMREQNALLGQPTRPESPYGNPGSGTPDDDGDGESDGPSSRSDQPPYGTASGGAGSEPYADTGATPAAP